MTFLYHVTLDTGDIGTFDREGVKDDAISTLAPHLRRAIAAGRDIIPTTTCSLMASRAGPFLLGTILNFTGAPILTFGVASRSRGAHKLWDMLTTERELASDPGEVPPAPWVATRIEPGASNVTLVGWMPDYQRCIAWAWIEEQANDAR